MPPICPTLTFDDRRNIETVCILTRANGPVAYNNCVGQQLANLGSQRAPDLSTLTFDDRRNIETACILTRASGPVAYNNCGNHHLSELRSAEPVAVTGSDAARSGAPAPRFSAMPPVSTTVPAAPSLSNPPAVVPHVPSFQYPVPLCAENGSCYGDISSITGLTKTVHVHSYFRRDGT
jgi:hypothetical protein